MKFENVERFIEWLNSVLERPVIEGSSEVQAWLDDVEKQYSETGSEYFEVESRMTKSGNPETYSFDVENVEVEEDVWETTITF